MQEDEALDMFAEDFDSKEADKIKGTSGNADSKPDESGDPSKEEEIGGELSCSEIACFISFLSDCSVQRLVLTLSDHVSLSFPVLISNLQLRICQYRGVFACLSDVAAACKNLFIWFIKDDALMRRDPSIS